MSLFLIVVGRGDYFCPEDLISQGDINNISACFLELSEFFCALFLTPIVINISLTIIPLIIMRIKIFGQDPIKFFKSMLFRKEDPEISIDPITQIKQIVIIY
jgi:hypothetical protein